MNKVDRDMYNSLKDKRNSSLDQLEKAMPGSNAILAATKLINSSGMRDFRLKVISLCLFILPTFAVVAMNGTESVSTSLALLLVSFMSIIMICAHALLKTITDKEEENGPYTLAFDKKAKYLFTIVRVNSQK